MSILHEIQVREVFLTYHPSLRRWADLQSFVFVPPSLSNSTASNSSPINFSNAPTAGAIHHLHPIALLPSLKDSEKGTVITINFLCGLFKIFVGNIDLTRVQLSPVEMVQLYDNMVAVVGIDSLKNLDFINQRFTSLLPPPPPSLHLFSCNVINIVFREQFIDRSDIVLFERELLNTFAKFSPDQQNAIAAKFHKVLPGVFER